MKLVPFNLRFGGKKDDGNAWQQLFRDFAPDIKCAHRSRPIPHGLPHRYRRNPC